MKNIIAVTTLLAAGTLFASAETGTVSFTGGTSYNAGTTVGSLTLVDAMTTGTPSSWNDTEWGADALPTIYGGDFYAGDYTLSLWFDASNFSTTSDTLLFVYSGSTTSDSLGYNGLTWDVSEQKFVIGRGNFVANGMTFTYNTDANYSPSSSTLTNSVSLNSGLNNVTLAVTGANQSQVVTLYLNGQEIETLASYKGNMNNKNEDMKYFVNTGVTYGDISLMDSKVANLSEANLFALTGTIPEPSAFGLLAGAGALALVAARRRRQKKA